MRGDKHYDETKEMLNILRETKTHINTKRFKLNESEKKKDVIAITNDPKFGQNVLQNQIEAFKQAVNGSAKFAKPDDEHPENSPLTYFPKTGNVVFSGSIQALNNLKFQFVLNSTDGAPYVFADALTLSENTILVLNKLFGYYNNWREQWWSSSDLLDKLN
jgi:hypothetical protein